MVGVGLFGNWTLVLWYVVCGKMDRRGDWVGWVGRDEVCRAELGGEVRPNEMRCRRDMSMMYVL